MMTTEPMTTRGAHYTALLETMDHQGSAKLHAKEREQLLEAADALLFGEPEREDLLRSAESLIELLETSERWSAESSTACASTFTAATPPAGAAERRSSPLRRPPRSGCGFDLEMFPVTFVRAEDLPVRPSWPMLCPPL